MDIDTITTMLTKVAIFSPIVMGLVQVVKMTGLPAQYMPLVAVVIGIGFGLLFVALSPLGALAGIALGLSAVGLYEFTTTTVASFVARG